MINIYSLPPLISSLLFLALGILVLNKGHDKRGAPLPFFLNCFVTFWWQFSWFILFNTGNEMIVSYLVKVGYTGITFIPVTFFHFHTFFNNPEKFKKYTRIYYFIGFIFVLILWLTNRYINGFYLYFWGHYPKAGIVHPIFLFYLFWIIGHSLYVLISGGMRRNWQGKIGNQIKFLLISYFIYCIAATDFLVNYGIEFYPLGIIVILISLCIDAYVIVKHQLMDVEIILKKTIIFAGLSSFVLGIIVTTSFIIQKLLGELIGKQNIGTFFISAIAIIFLYERVKSFLVNITDKFLFQKKYGYEQILKDFIGEITSVFNLDEIAISTIRLLDKTMHPYSVGVFMLNRPENKYQLYEAQGIEDNDVSFRFDSRLIKYFRENNQPAYVKELNGLDILDPSVQNEIRNISAVLCLPLKLKEDVIGFISLGNKKSDEEYTKEDINVLQDLVKTESIAIGNALLLQEAAQAERRAAIGTMAAGINHEIGNPINTINTKIQVFLKGIEKGFYDAKSKEEIIDECKNIVIQTINQTNRISDITRRLSNFAKPSKEFKPKAIDISEEVDEVMAVIGHDIPVEKILIEKEIQDSVRVLADPKEMQQILFNLIRNAAQSIDSEGKIIIRAKAINNNRILVEIEDNGKGIPENKREKVFDPFFTTKTSEKGTGLGLSIVRQLVWRNNGQISFKSEENKGTTFILDFKRYNS